MIFIPMIIPTNMDLLFGVYVLLFYGYGVYLHWGYEAAMLPAHNSIFNTSYHHYIHHAVSARGRPIFTGFFFKIWDHVFNTTEAPDRACSCVECRPKRTLEDWKKVKKPDYSVLLSLSWWLNPVVSATASKAD
jgi:lathosterol oxidase